MGVTVLFETLLTQVEYTGGAEVRAVWTEPMPGIRVCDFDCPAPEWMNMEKEAIAVSVYNLKKIGNKYA